jgi:hypothetical protein
MDIPEPFRRTAFVHAPAQSADRCSALRQRMIAERFGGLVGQLVSRDRRAIREKIEIEPKIRKWFSASHQAKYLRSRFDPARTLNMHEAANGGRVVR